MEEQSKNARAKAMKQLKSIKVHSERKSAAQIIGQNLLFLTDGRVIDCDKIQRNTRDRLDSITENLP